MVQGFIQLLSQYFVIPYSVREDCCGMVYEYTAVHDTPNKRQDKKSGPGWIPYLRMGAFYTNFSIIMRQGRGGDATEAVFSYRQKAS